MGHDKLFQKRKIALERRARTRNPRTILIVCEGEKTEPNYFRAFSAKPNIYDRIDVEGTGYNTVSLVERAIELKNTAVREKAPYIEVWCVFDRDDFPLENFEEALRMAEANRIKCAYSIEAFEIWYMLHFNYYDAAFSRRQYKDKLSELLGKPYLKNDAAMYSLLAGRQSRAIQNAKKLHAKQCRLPARERNPVTTVFALVERLIGQE